MMNVITAEALGRGLPGRAILQFAITALRSASKQHRDRVAEARSQQEQDKFVEALYVPTTASRAPRACVVWGENNR